MFLKSLLAQHVSDVISTIVRSTTVVYSHRFFGFLCVYSMRLVMVFQSETDRDIVTMCPNIITSRTEQTHQKPIAVHYSCGPDNGCCDVRNMLS
jgi:hypothetical protein